MTEQLIIGTRVLEFWSSTSWCSYDNNSLAYLFTPLPTLWVPCPALVGWHAFSSSTLCPVYSSIQCSKISSTPALILQQQMYTDFNHITSFLDHSLSINIAFPAWRVLQVLLIIVIVVIAVAMLLLLWMILWLVRWVVHLSCTALSVCRW